MASCMAKYKNVGDFNRDIDDKTIFIYNFKNLIKNNLEFIFESKNSYMSLYNL